MKKILEVKNICKTYQAKNGEIEALKNISFDIKEGEYISIIGPSGCGKQKDDRAPAARFERGLYVP